MFLHGQRLSWDSLSHTAARTFINSRCARFQMPFSACSSPTAKQLLRFTCDLLYSWRWTINADLFFPLYIFLTWPKDSEWDSSLKCLLDVPGHLASLIALWVQILSHLFELIYDPTWIGRERTRGIPDSPLVAFPRQCIHLWVGNRQWDAFFFSANSTSVDELMIHPCTNVGTVVAMCYKQWLSSALP